MYLRAAIGWCAFAVAAGAGLAAIAQEAVAPETIEAQQEEVKPLFYKAYLRGMNKVTARKAEFAGPVGTVQRFANLEIVVQRCETRAGSYGTPEDWALLEVWELKPNEKSTRIFNGWMMAQSPSVSSLLHPVYDLQLLKCEGSETPPE